MMLSWIICVILFASVIFLIVKIILLRKGINEICDEFCSHLSADTNTFISVSGAERSLRIFASEINKQLSELQKQRHRYLSGDAELKTAVTNISHDLRTPLTAIFGYLELLEQEEVNDITQQYLDSIKNRAEVLKTLTEELFRYSVIMSASDDLEITNVIISSVLEKSIAGMYIAFKNRGIVPKVIIPEEKIICRGNEEALERVFNNILGNALKYSDGDLNISLSKDGIMIFSNTAKSLSEVQAGKLFDRFYTVESARNSSGLGLSIAKHLIEQMGGIITAGYKDDQLDIILKLNQ